MPNCAYCGNKDKMSREHVIPSWLYEATKYQNIQLLNVQPKKFINVEQKVKDVCEPCNNEALSILDNYVKELYSKYFRRIVKKDETIDFDFDFDFLTRWLLKVSFNSARANKGNHYIFNKLLNYILEGNNRPPELTVLVQLVTPQILSQREKDLILDENLRKIGVITPNTTRISSLDNRTTLIDSQKFDLARMIMLNSYQFFILLPSDKVESDREWNELINQFGTSIITSGIHKLLPTENNIKIRASKVKMIDTLGHHLKQNINVYRQFMNDQK